MKKTTLIVCLLMAGVVAFPQDNTPKRSHDRGFSLETTPGISIPLPLTIEEERIDIYTVGATMDVEGMFSLFPFLNINLGLNYTFNPVVDAYHPETGNPLFLSIISIGPGVGLGWTFLDFLDVRADLRAGGYLGFVSRGQTSVAINPFVSGGLGLSFRLLPFMSIVADGTYRYHFGLQNDITVTLGASFHFGQGGKQEGPAKGDFLDLYDTEFNIFPVLFKYYDDHPVGTTTIKNVSRRPVEGVTVTLYGRQYMDDPKLCGTPFTLQPGEEETVDLLALFNREVLQISEGTKSSCTITMEYNARGREYVQEYVQTMDLENRNAITWDDDRKAAAFVTAKDPTVLKFAKNVAGIVKEYTGARLNTNLLTAAGVHEALRKYGMSYVIDPTTPYKELSKKSVAVDFLQFPNQTLTFRAGDCDDLSILYCALLESVGIETAFITIPGHIYMALSLDILPVDTEEYFPDPKDLIIKHGKTWLPIEVTALDSGFAEAWGIGAKEWREHAADENARLYPVHKAWETYAAVGFEAPPEPITFPDTEAVTASFMKEVGKIVREQIYPQIQSLEKEIGRTQGAPKWENKLGTLYARYGLYEDAEQQFRKALAKGEYLPALYNLGNIFFLREQYGEAEKYYRRAERLRPGNPRILLALSRIYRELERFEESKAAYEKLAAAAPKLAEKYDYLGGGSEETARASAAGGKKGEMIWESE